MTKDERRARIKNIARLLGEISDLKLFVAELAAGSSRAIALNDATINQFVSLSVELGSGRKTYTLNEHGARFLSLSETEREAEKLTLLP